MWGYKNDTDKRVLKEQYKRKTMVYNVIYIIRSSFQDFLAGITLNPTFRFAPCGAEICHFFGMCATRIKHFLNP
ncbi:hypothetical protein Barb4_01673 [Bacteroidales bacterium Barb4]|nr:hypothetical protein Barb4_01673 [Bacteroidales bacterium Barb4]